MAGPSRLRQLRDPPQRRSRSEDHAGAARRCHLPRLPGRGAGPRRPPPRLPLHQLHQLRPALQHHPGAALRPPQHHHAPLRHVPGLPGGVRRSRATAASMPSPTRARCVGHELALWEVRERRRQHVSRCHAFTLTASTDPIHSAADRPPRRPDRGGQGVGWVSFDGGCWERSGHRASARAQAAARQTVCGHGPRSGHGAHRCVSCHQRRRRC